MKKQTETERTLFRAFYRGNKLRWAFVMSMSAVNAGLNMVIAWLLKESVDVISTGDLSWLYRLLILGTACFIGSSLLDLILYRVRGRFLQTAMEQYKAAAFSYISEKSISAFSREKTGRYLAVLSNDIPDIENNYLYRSYSLVFQILLGLCSAGMMVFYSWKLAAVCVALAAVPVAVTVFMSAELENRTTGASDAGEAFVAQVKDLLGGFSVLKSFKAEQAACRLFNRANAGLERVKFSRRWWAGMLQTVQSFASLVLQFGVVFLGAYMAIRGEISPGTAIAMINLSGNLINSVSSVPEIWASRKSAKALVRKMARIAQENTQRAGAPVPKALSQGIVLSHVGFSYEPEKPVLRDISLTLEPGKKYAIVGASGSGKSTLLNLLMAGCEGYSGSITLDGQELNTLDPDGLYDLMSLIGQKVFLFDNTIRENITLFRDFPAEKVESAIARSGLGSVIRAKGEEYRCGENGQGLSGGEGQRISIARSLLRENQVLMLDEATAALDNRTAFEVTDAILRLEGLTRIVVTHRLEEALLRQYDTIFVLREGGLTEQGKFDALMDIKGYFYSLYHVSNG